MASLKRLLVGSPIRTERLTYERLTKKTALAVFSSDALSSTAYATEQILLVLAAAYMVGQTQAFSRVVPITIGIATLLVIVAISYRQTVHAYPSGGGSYIVAKDNLGTLPGLTAAASLMIDYVLTVSVSVAAGVLALVTLFPSLQPDVVTIDVVLVALITMINLRGVRESGTIFTLPTYLFIVTALLLIIIGCFKAFLIDHRA